MPVSVEIQGLLVTIVRSRIILPEIAVHQGLNQQQLQHMGLDPLQKDVSTVWAR
ncbi:hypothetical protein A2U01_0115917, partial [Trifolium medium]|nr:hypothetical protein [Trifolium medium]